MHAASVIETVRRLYSEGPMYGKLTQLQHGLQCAEQARKAGADEETIVAALLHDVGWALAAATRHGECGTVSESMEGQGIISDRAPESDCLAAKLGILAHCGVECGGGEAADEEQRRAQHDVIGGTWLRMQGFHEKVPHLIEGHVLAKRYLVAADEAYATKLSPASVRTLVFQGGKMTPKEMAIMEQDPLFEECKRLRLWDEGAKVEGLDVPGLEAHLARIEKVIVRSPRPARQCFSQTFVRQGNEIVGLRRAAPSRSRSRSRSQGHSLVSA